MAARALMFQGTGSDVGKSLLVAGLCRAFANRGLKVAPFKPQNMSNNAAVTADGGEIGRAQALQARAARMPLSVHMNPVLLKPQGETGAQVVVQGKVRATAKAAAYQALKPTLMPEVLDSFHRLKADADLVLVEGAGSASEVNLRTGDIANMGFARAADVPVVVIGDIDRGGVIASLVGTKAVIEPEDAALVTGFIVNKFRGDPALFASGLDRIAALTGWRSFGLVPHFADAARLPAEDALALAAAPPQKAGARRLICVPILPHISNFDDLDPLDAEPDVEVRRIRPHESLPLDTDVVLLVGSKATLDDLSALTVGGLHHDILSFARRGGRVLGLCGGYQMLGRSLSDPKGVEGPATTAPGLGLLAVDTVLSADKRLVEVEGRALGVPVHGYEMHMGETTGEDTARPFAALADGTRDGALSPDGRVAGTYVHGLFSSDAFRAAWLAQAGGAAGGVRYEAQVEDTLDRLAAHLAAHLDLEGLLSQAR